MTAAEIFNNRIAPKLAEKAEKVRAINTVYEFNITDENVTWSIDLTKEKDFVSEGSTGQSKCIVSIKSTDLEAILDKKLNPQMAFMTGKLKVKGDMGLALKLGTVL